MNIFFFLPDNPLSPFGGVGVKFYDIIYHLSNRYNCLVLCINTPSGQINRAKIVPITQFPQFLSTNSFEQQKLYKSLIEELFRVEKFDPDVVVGVDYLTAHACVEIARAYQCRFVMEFDLCYTNYSKLFNKQELTVRNNQISEYILSREKEALSACDGIITCSKNYMSQFHQSYQNKIVPIQNGIDTSKYIEYCKTKTKNFFPKDGRKHIVYLGRANYQKGTHLLFDIFLPDDLCLHMFVPKLGSAYYSDVVKYAERKNVFLHDAVFGNTKLDVFKSADAFILPSVHEPFGIVGIEAAIMGTPVITTRVDGIKDYLDEDCCISCLPTTSSICGGITEFHLMKSEQLKTRISNAFQKAQHFTTERMVMEYENYFNRFTV